jgi:hypothetical protein
MSVLSRHGTIEPGLPGWLHLAKWTLSPERRERPVRIDVAKRSALIHNGVPE